MKEAHVLKSNIINPTGIKSRVQCSDVDYILFVSQRLTDFSFFFLWCDITSFAPKTRKELILIGMKTYLGATTVINMSIFIIYIIIFKIAYNVN